MLKLILESLDGLDESTAALYTEKDGKFHLEVDGLEDTGALKRAKDHEKAQRLDAEKKLRDLQGTVDGLTSKLEEIDNSGHRKKGDIEALEASWKAKYDKLENDKDTEIGDLNGSLQKVLVDNEAVRLSGALALKGSEDVLLPHIKSRLSVEKRDGEFTTVVLGTDGKPSALTIDELSDEIKGNKAYAPIIAGSQASGSGGSGGSGGGAAQKVISRDNFDAMSQAERAAHVADGGKVTDAAA